MTDDPPAAPPSFADAAKLVRNRLIVRNGIKWLLRSWLYAAGIVVFLVVMRVVGFGMTVGVLATGVLLLWFAGCVGWAVYRRPALYASLAYWDLEASRNDAFANAWWFEGQPWRSDGQQLHLDIQTRRLGEALDRLREEIPLPKLRVLALPPLLALGLCLIPVKHDGALADPKLSTEGKEIAKREGRRLAEAKIEAEKMPGLTAPEKRAVEKLQEQIHESAQALAQGSVSTARGVLKELERRARDVERLAEKMAVGEGAWASEQMIAEMRRHADTAELGDAVAAKSAEQTAAKAQELADKLKDPKLTDETRDRFTATLRDIGKKAQPDDKEHVVGQHVIQADKDLTQVLPRDAAQEFQAIADKMRALATREKARQQLEQLAQQLRDAGSAVAGQGTEGMQQLGEGERQGGQGSNGQGGQMQALQNAPPLQPMQVPGLSGSQAQTGQNPGQQQQQQLTLTPSSGMLQPAPGDGSKDDKSKDGSNSPPTLIAPIPGEKPDRPPSMAMLGNGPQLAMEVPGPGGSKAGHGTAPLGNKPTQAQKAGRDAEVNAQHNADGASSVRAVQGEARHEQASRSAESTALSAISSEENALDDASLPPARREQVRRYFTELRKRFEKDR